MDKEKYQKKLLKEITKELEAYKKKSQELKAITG
jgi:hypothetical protein